VTDTAAPQSPWAAGPGPAPVLSETDDMAVIFTGKRGALFWLALKTGFFTILTLGFYRFWMKTRLRRWYWSAIRPGGHPLEYVGDPWEKLLGFFIAVVILTFYIGIVNLLLMFVSFSIFSSSWVGYVASLAGVIPLWFYAQYRARRYVLARTRWRSVRFGLEPGAWGYAVRAMGHWAVTICTLGLLWPRMTFSLEKYRTDRTFFGSARLRQGGRWPMLYRAAIPFMAAVVLTGGSVAWLFWIDPLIASDALSPRVVFENLRDMAQGGTFRTGLNHAERLLLVPFCLSALLYGAIHYRFVAKRLMAQHKMSNGIFFTSRLSGPRVVFIYMLGNFLAYLVLVLGVGVLVFTAIATLGPATLIGIETGELSLLAKLPRWLSLMMLAAFYLGIFLMWGVLLNTFVTFPLMRHMARTLSLPRAEGLHAVSQRARDEFAEAEGFAEALDLGAAI
jgi:uncharacterized membrane protein YjgN (DUF898 family)